MLLSSTRKRKIHTGSLVYEKSDDWGQPAHINITLMIFQLKLNERLCYCVKELKVCVRHWLVGIIICYGYKELLDSYCAGVLTSVIHSIEKEITLLQIHFFIFIYETGLNPADGFSGVSEF